MLLAVPDPFPSGNSIRRHFDAAQSEGKTGDELLLLVLNGVPNGIRTRVAAVKGRCPRPLDDGGAHLRLHGPGRI